MTVEVKGVFLLEVMEACKRCSLFVLIRGESRNKSTRDVLGEIIPGTFQEQQKNYGGLITEGLEFPGQNFFVSEFENLC